ncbi:hypothetical protein B0T10DRAFT_483685 [Thelonectria olida]|uniref:Azaphilone pigments biosynthesis cluster protein L N-terminal domain-containing protein n=1 Tax=Thelonectria olida TaxID=1576542 RepID=A0A9P8W6K3_9HYPO|nr:hypothetical protein B0T10DRAFT_483685 [Thelonectria olida]
MDPLSIAASAFSLAAGIAKASLALTQFSNSFREAAEDLNAISAELQALAGILDPLTRALCRRRQSPLPESLLSQLENTLSSCVLMIEQILDTIENYRRNTAWTKTKWVLIGKDEVFKLRDSLEAYKMALSIGLHALSLDTTQDIKDDTEVIRTHIEVLNLNTDEILARVKCLREMGSSRRNNRKIEEWMENMSLLSNYAESTYKSTIADPAEFTSPPVLPTLAPVTEVGQQKDFDSQTASPAPQPPPDATRVTEHARLSLKSSSTPNPLDDTSVQELRSNSGSNSSAQVSDSLGPETKPLDHLIASCDGVEECSQRIEEVRLLVRLDKGLIEKSRKAHEGLSGDQKKELLDSLRRITHTTTAESLRALIAQGAMMDDYTVHSASPLYSALRATNNDCLITLLQCGANPNAEELLCKIGNRCYAHRSALAYAAWSGNEFAVWALVAAGAIVNPEPRDTISCITPLLQAVQPEDTNKLENQDRIIRFLLANGADPNESGCSPPMMSPPLSAAMVFWPRQEDKFPGKTLSVVNSLLKAGARSSFGHLDSVALWDVDENPFNAAARWGQHEVLTSLASRVNSLDSEAWIHAMSYAALHRQWKCFDILCEKPYTRSDALHQIVENSMAVFRCHRSPIIDSTTFTAVITKLMDDRDRWNPDKQVEFIYQKRRYMVWRKLVIEELSAMELAKNIHTEVDRNNILALLGLLRG